MNTETPLRLTFLSEHAPSDMLSAEALAAIFGCHPETIKRWPALGFLPAPMRLGHRDWWRVDQIDDHLHQLARKAQQDFAAAQAAAEAAAEAELAAVERKVRRLPGGER